jgi:hypothetical protein
MKTSGSLKLKLATEKRGNSLEMGVETALPVAISEGATGGHNVRMKEKKPRSPLLTDSPGQEGSTD